MPFMKSWLSGEAQLKNPSETAVASSWGAFLDKASSSRGLSQRSLSEETDVSSAVSMYSSTTEVELPFPPSENNGYKSYSNADDFQSPSYESVQALRQDAVAGVAQAQYLLAQMYDKGEITCKGQGEGENEAGDLSQALNLVQAFEWYLKAGNQGHVLAQRSLGNMYKLGHGVPEDYTKAQEWFTKASDRGDEHSLMTLAFMKKNGQGGPKDIGGFLELTGKALAPLLFEGRFT